MIVCVFAEAPVPGKCLVPLIPYNDEGWLARLYAAMLRDTLDGLEAVAAERYVVISNAEGDDRAILRRHLPAPWELVDTLELPPAMIIASANAPSANVEPLFALPSAPYRIEGRGWLIGGADDFHAECTNIVTLPPAIVVESQPALDALAAELRDHHERAPRTALLVMTS